MLVELVDQLGHTILVNIEHIVMIDLVTCEIILTNGTTVIVKREELERQFERINS